MTLRARLRRRAAALDRSDIMIAAGAAVLVLGALQPWSVHPSAVHSAVSPAGALLLAEQPFALDLLVRFTFFLAGLLYVWLVACGRRPTRWHLRGAWLLPAIAIAFPCWLVQLYPERMAERQLLYRQLNRVVDDIDANLIEQQVDWRAWQTLTRRFLSDVPYLQRGERLWQPAYFVPANVDRVVQEVVGLSPEFLGFFRPALALGLCGGIGLLLCGLHLAAGGGLGAARRGLAVGLTAAAVLVALPLGSRLVGELHLIAAERANRTGDDARALDHLRAAERWKPDLAGAWWHHRKLGELFKRMDRPTALEALLADAYDALAERRPLVAVDKLELARMLHPGALPTERFVAVALAEAGAEAFGDGQIDLAEAYWKESLRHLAINPTPWYGLALAHAKKRRYDDATRCLEQLVALQRYLGYKRLPVRGQTLVVRSWAAFHRGELAAAHDLQSRSLRPETW